MGERTTMSRNVHIPWLLIGLLMAGGGCDPGSPSGSNAPQTGSDDAPPADRRAEAPQSGRRFRFTYDVTIQNLPPRAVAQVWVPVAQDTPEQCVEVETIRVPAPHRLTTERRFGNRLLHFEAAASDAGEIPVRVEYRIERFEATPDRSPATEKEIDQHLDRSALELADGEVIRRLLPGGLPAGSNLERGRTLFDSVGERLTYDKSLPGWGRGDVAWACESGRGNCSDFHSVFISACRDLRIPARFEIGFPIPADRPAGDVDGYHCWARFVHEDRWLAVDISEADKHPEQRNEYFGRLAADRVQFTAGRDLVLEPEQQGGPVNFLIYPYVEIDGPIDVELSKRFRFEELTTSVCRSADGDDDRPVSGAGAPRGLQTR